MHCTRIAADNVKWQGRRSMSRLVTPPTLKALAFAALIYCCSALTATAGTPKFKVIAFFTAKQDQAHISFVHEAERWFPEVAAKYEFSFGPPYCSRNLNPRFLVS